LRGFAGWDEKDFGREENAFEVSQITHRVFDFAETEGAEKLAQVYLAAPGRERFCPIV
jgi:hypothetical protein